ncbi:hypothetical protein KQ753_15480, partial [Listeria monocytogenes]|nr:hypothetical protein [Listeria monocytogenes]
SKKAVQRSKDDAVREHPFWRLLSTFASPQVAPVSIAIALLLLGGGLPLASLPLLWACLPEAVRFLARRAPDAARLRRILERLG